MIGRVVVSVERAMGRWGIVTAAISTLAAAPAAAPAMQGTPPNPLRALDSAVERLVDTVAPSVVQVKVTGYGPIDTGNSGDAGVIIGREQAVGSGAIMSADGYIVTNAHVVAGAQRVQVVLHGPVASDQLGQFLAGDSERTLEARIVGTAQDIDLALLKIDASGLRPIPFADFHKIQQGELVFAFGSPAALHNSVTMGIVSSVARQPNPDSPTVYIQTDAPINPGNSGGPLVNAEGELVGLNTFILSESGGSQGLGFAIPSTVVSAAYTDLRSYGYVRRGTLGIAIQANSAPLATGLQLSKTSGVLVSDVMPDSAAAAAGLKPGDVVMAINGTPTPTVAMFGLELLGHAPGERVTLNVLRGSSTSSITVPMMEEAQASAQLLALADVVKNSVPPLGIIGVDINAETAGLLPKARIPSGVLVAARNEASQLIDNPLTTGDIIHAINRSNVPSLDILRLILDGLDPNSRIVLQIERNGQLRYVTMRLE